MFCFQCQETAKNTGCTVKGVCGKPEETARLQDLLIFVMKGIAVCADHAAVLGFHKADINDFMMKALSAADRD